MAKRGVTKLGSSNLGQLPDGGRVVVIGGGPAGVAAAVAVQRNARALGRRVHVTIVEGKQFAGEQHHNTCSGVLSPPIVELLEQVLDIPFPHHLARGAITTYVLHTGCRTVVLDGDFEPSAILRRVQFDAYMLEAACRRGIEVVRARATALEFHSDRVILYTENAPLTADVVIGAFGLDEGTATLFARGVGYRPPRTLNAIVTKYHPGDAAMANFGQCIHAFLPATPRIEFGAITPKGNHLTINIAGATVDTNMMDAFLKTPEVRGELPSWENAGRFDSDDLRYYKGRLPCGLARNFSGDRFVMVGDAAGLVRAFKGKGVTSAVLTGIRAAEVITRQGMSATAFQAYHAANRDIMNDMPYGQAVRHLTILASRYGLMKAVVAAATAEPRLSHALFEAISGYEPYRLILRQIFSAASIRAMATAFLRGEASLPPQRFNHSLPPPA